MSSAHPDAWARDKRSKLQRYAEGEVASFSRAARDVMLPGVPVAALLGFAANGARNENTTGWIVGDDAERAHALIVGRKPLGGDPRDGYGAVGGKPSLHELGPFGVEAGYTPSAVATDAGCPWVSLARSEGVRTVLARDGVTGPRWHGAVEDQCVIGVANLRRHLGAVRSRLDESLQWDPDAPVTLWGYALAMMSWSAGSGGAAKHVHRYTLALASAPEAQRWGLFVRLAAGYTGDGHRHARPSYSALRTAQKLSAGRLAAQWTGEGDAALAWLDDGLDDERAAVYDALVKASP